MEVLYQLSYVGAAYDPIALAADRDAIQGTDDHLCQIVFSGAH